MTPQEAITEITSKVYRNTDNFEMKISKECYKQIISALEKQIAKRPLDYDGKIQVGFCPDCEECVSSDFCYNCGQALDWGG